MNAAEFREQVKPLLRPAQVERMEEDVRSLEAELQAPPYIRNQLQDIGQKRAQLQQTQRDLEAQRPKPYRTDELDAAKARHDTLLDQIVTGMPTDAEMRRRPQGAVEKHMLWEKRNKAAVLEIKNIRLRLHASGLIPGVADAGEVANIEKFRPIGGSQELNMHGNLIEGREYHLPPPGAERPTVFSDEQISTLKEVAPDLGQRLASLTNAQRATVKTLLETLDGDPEPTEPEPKKKREWPFRQKTTTEIGQLRKQAKQLGLNSWGKSKIALKHMIAEEQKRIAAEGAAEE